MASHLRDNPCYDLTRRPEGGKKRCPQCWKIKDFPREFVGLSGGVIQACTSCSEKKAAYCKRWRLRKSGVDAVQEQP